MQVEPATDERSGEAGVQVTERGLEQIEERRRGRALDGEAVDELRAVPARGDATEVLAQRRVDRTRFRAGEHVELATARQLIGGVRERLGMASHPARRATDPLRDDVHLAEVAGEEDEDPVGLTEVDRAKDDGLSAIRTGRHQR